MPSARDRLLVTAPVALIFVAIAPANANVFTTVNKSVQRMIVAVDGEPRWNWPVSSGRAGYATPSGAYTAFRAASHGRVRLSPTNATTLFALVKTQGLGEAKVVVDRRNQRRLSRG